MRGVLIFMAMVVLNSVSAIIETQRGYHVQVGIPLFKRIKDIEQRITEKYYTDIESRIIGGTGAPNGSYPYFAGLLIDLMDLPMSACGSTLLSANRLITAAHCWFDGTAQARLLTVVLGTNYFNSGGIRIATNQSITHPNWSPPNMNNDIAIICLPTNVVFDDTIRRINILNALDLENIPEGTSVVAVGFGGTSDQNSAPISSLKEVTLQVMSNTQCQASFEVEIGVTKICTLGTGGVGTCGEDSGGPLLLNHNEEPILIGVSSFTSAGGCEIQYPSVFSRITSYKDFILQHL